MVFFIILFRIILRLVRSFEYGLIVSLPPPSCLYLHCSCSDVPSQCPALGDNRFGCNHLVLCSIWCDCCLPDWSSTTDYFCGIVCRNLLYQACYVEFCPHGCNPSCQWWHQLSVASLDAVACQTGLITSSRFRQKTFHILRNVGMKCLFYFIFKLFY